MELVSIIDGGENSCTFSFYILLLFNNIFHVILVQNLDLKFHGEITQNIFIGAFK